MHEHPINLARNISGCRVNEIDVTISQPVLTSIVYEKKFFTNEGQAGSVDVIKQIDIFLSLYLRQSFEHCFADDRVRGSTDELKIFIVGPGDSMLGPMQHSDGGGRLSEKFTPAPPVLLDHFLRFGAFRY